MGQGGAQYDVDKTETHGKIIVLEEDFNQDGKVELPACSEVPREHGRLRSARSTTLRDESQFHHHQSPFSLFREVPRLDCGGRQSSLPY